MMERNRSAVRASSLAIVFILVAAAAPALARQAPTGDAGPAKRPGVKRIGVTISGSAAAAVSDELVRMLHGDGTIIEAMPLTASLEAFRLAEAKRKECDFVLSATFETQAKKSGNVFSSALDVARGLSKDSEGLGTTAALRDDTDRKASSVDKMAQRLAPEPKDKVRVVYKLTAIGAAAPVLTNDKEIVAGDVPAFLEKFLNDVVMSAMK